jgi:ankyrin repeat protein
MINGSTWDYKLMLNNPSILEFHVLNDNDNINEIDKNGDSILNFMLKNNANIKTIELLLKNYADVNLKNKEGYYPLSYAIINKDKNIIELLLKYGAIIEFKDFDDIKLKSKLKKFSIKYEKINIKYKFFLKKLLFYGKNIKEGNLKLLKLYENELTYYLNYEKGLFFYEELNTSVIFNHLVVFNYLNSLYNGKMNSLGVKKLFRVIIYKKRINFLKSMLKNKNINLNELNNNNTILDYATYINNKEILTLLKEHGAKRACEILKTKCVELKCKIQDKKGDK